MPDKEKLKPVFQDDRPICPAAGCGSHNFDVTFLLISSDKWIVESAYCDRCKTEFEITDEFKEYIGNDGWLIRVVKG